MLNFTHQERAVIYFLVITLGLGAVLKVVRDRRLVDNLKPERFYSEEQQFKEIAESINSNELKYVDDAEPTRERSTKTAYERVDQGTVQEKININSAGVSELSNLPGIGPVLADRIHAYVENNGPFKTKEEIILVKGIGENLYSRIQDLVTIE